VSETCEALSQFHESTNHRFATSGRYGILCGVAEGMNPQEFKLPTPDSTILKSLVKLLHLGPFLAVWL